MTENLNDIHGSIRKPPVVATYRNAPFNLAFSQAVGNAVGNKRGKLYDD